MKDASTIAWRLPRPGPSAAISAILIAAGGFGLGCGSSDDNTNPTDTGVAPSDGSDDTGSGGDSSTDTGTDAGPPGNGTIGTSKAAANGAAMSAPWDAVPDSTGANVYFTAQGKNGPGVFSVVVATGVITELFSGDPLAAPVGIAISPDDKQLFIADPAAGTSADQGAIYSLAVGGGTPSVLGGTDGTVPRSLTTSATDIVFSGQDTTGKVGVFKVALAGGAITSIATGSPFLDPSGVAISSTGDVYVLDTIAAASARATLFKVSGGAATTVVTDLAVGYPGGVALAQDESAVLVSGLNPATWTDAIWRVDLATKAQTSFTTSINTFMEPAGLHRAKGADIYAWVDSLATPSGSTGQGTVFVLSK